MQKVFSHTGVSSALLFLSLITSACSSRNEPQTPWFPSTQSVKAEFTFQVLQPMTVALTNCSENASSYQWSFGDGETSAEPNPTHRYKSKGVYEITLTACNNHGTQSAYATAKIEEPSLIFISGFTIGKIPYENQYYRIEVIDDDFFTTTWVQTEYRLLSSAIVPYTANMSKPVLLSGLSDDNYYVMRLYYSTKSSGTGTKVGSWKMTKAQILQYPESLTGTSDDASLTTYFSYK